MVIIVRSGFQEIVLDVFRKKSISKGRKLLDSCHVSDVREESVCMHTALAWRSIPKRVCAHTRMGTACSQGKRRVQKVKKK